ncbi:MAG: hypothetical protein OIF54_05330 [Cohaesibacter sp.]|nr:hypothetical protein [Cohaesibacter sp.]
MKHNDKIPFQHFVEINATLFGAALMGTISYISIPTDPRWWGLYFITVCCGLEAVILVWKAILKIKKVLKFEADRKELETLGAPQKSASLAPEDFLTNKGVIQNDK